MAHRKPNLTLPKRRGCPTSEQARKREERVREAMTVMLQGSWVSGVSSRQLQAKWGVHVRICESICGEASRRLIHGVELEPGMKTILYGTIQQIGADCERLNQVMMTQPRVKVVDMVMALRLKFDVCRYLRGPDAGEVFSAMTQQVLNAEMYKQLCSQGWRPPPVAGLPELNSNNPDACELPEDVETIATEVETKPNG